MIKNLMYTLYSLVQAQLHLLSYIDFMASFYNSLLK